MNFNLNTKNLLDILTSHPWDAGTGRKMLFLKRRYYVFDEEHKLQDGGIINYNETLDKIFIRNEDLRGEVFITLLKDEKVSLKGSLYSNIAGKININNTLKKYNKELIAPLSRVAKVEKYLSSTDIFNILNMQEEVDKLFLRNFDTNMHSFSPEQSKIIYIKLSQEYFKNHNKKVLESISFYFSSYSVHAKLYEEMFMFLMSLQMFYERRDIQKEDIDFFILCVKDRLLDAYAWTSPIISINLINECLLYFDLSSPYLPTPEECVKNIKNLNTRKEYAFYLSLMKGDIKEYEEDIFKILLEFFGEYFQIFKDELYKSEFIYSATLNKIDDYGISLALLESLGNCRSKSNEVHIFYIFLLFSSEDRVQKQVKKALIKCEKDFYYTLSSLSALIQSQIIEYLNNLK